ncbi:MAG: pyruvate, phosphate dikinase [Porticoccaceae bacterium]|nr:pyruvate, phosphate dikinase [Porticoccaceae bacterium]
MTPGTDRDASGAQWVYLLDGAQNLSRELIGGKAWSINWMRSLGMPVPPAATLCTDAYAHYEQTGALPDPIWRQIVDAVAHLESVTGRTFGAGPRPLLVSVRSGAAESMPGMMDTVLNLGINSQTCQSLAEESGDPDFATRTLALFQNQYRDIILGSTDGDVPEDVWQQLRGAVEAVLASWQSPRAKAYRDHYDITELKGTSVTVQAMVFGNLDEQSGSGVLFTRNPGTGSKEPYGQWLPRAQGEDIVSGRMTPEPIATLEQKLPDQHRQLLELAGTLERTAGNVQDIEFTIEHGNLWLLQARNAKRSPRAAVDFAVQLCEEGLIDEREALARVTPEQVRQLLKPGLDPAAVQSAAIFATGEPACPGIASGVVVSSADEAVDREEEGVVLARPTTSPDDIHGMLSARAIVTELGGATSHAAVVSREIGVPCVVGCGRDTLSPLRGQTVTVDGNSGDIYQGALPVVQFDESADPVLATLIRWAESLCPIEVSGLESPKYDQATDIGPLAHDLEQKLAGVENARGSALESNDGIRLAVDAGLKHIFVRHRLPAMLAAIMTHDKR